MNDTEVAIAAVEAGAAVVRRRFGTAMGRVEKGQLDFATDADLESERVMTAFLREKRPADAIVGEEAGRSGPANAMRQWLIDPLCGTRNYAAGMQVVAVNAALKADNLTLAAAVADPFTGETFWTDGRTASLRMSGKDDALVPHAGTKLVDLDFDASSVSSFSTAMLALDPSFNSRFRPRVVSTTLALTWVAVGRRAAYVADSDIRKKSVHFAAGLAICHAAGCIVTDLRGNPWEESGLGLIVAADEETHAALLKMVRQHLK